MLSGFILTYVYPSLDTWDERRRFWRACIARIWPACFASFPIAFVRCEPDGLHLRLAWERMVDRKLDYTTAVHVTDAKGAILAQRDFKSPAQQWDLRAGDVWVDTLVIAPGQLPPATAGVAVGLYDASVQMLAIDRGPTDWGGRRLVISVDRCPSA